MSQRNFAFTLLAALASLWAVSGCATSKNPLPTPEKVDLEKFMGVWFVHGYTPILVDKEAHNAVEHYYLNDKNQVETTYQFRKGGFDGELKSYTPKGFPTDDHARWQMQFIWPLKSDYVIVHVSEDYENTIIGHPSRKYAWVMSRDHKLSDSEYESLLNILKEAGYDTSIVKRLPQDWSDKSERLQELEELGTSAPLVGR